jgi:flagellar biogenesis protein FliO
MIDKLKVMIYEPILKALAEIFATPMLKVIGMVALIGFFIWMFKKLF